VSARARIQTAPSGARNLHPGQMRTERAIHGQRNAAGLFGDDYADGVGALTQAQRGAMPHAGGGRYAWAFRMGQDAGGSYQHIAANDDGAIV